MGYREEFIKHNPGVRRPRMGGYWYKCAICGGWCGRPGAENYPIPQDIRMEVDHILPWSQGGSDDIWNLQPTHRKCNRNKSANMTKKDGFKTGVNTILHPVDTLVKQPIRRAVRHNKVLNFFGIGIRK